MSLFKQHTQWHFDATGLSASDCQQLSDFDRVLSLPVRIVSSDDVAQMGYIELDQAYYVKVYKHGGGLLRQLIGLGRFDRELANLQLFARLGIPTPKMISWGKRSSGPLLDKGSFTTIGLQGCHPLSELAQSGKLQQYSVSWLKQVMQQVADYSRRLHDDGFFHVDLKWRNILVDPSGKVYFIDCPSGYHPPTWYLPRAIIKDLACLDKVAKYQLSRSQRLYFYKRYTGTRKLSKADKKRIKRIVNFFKGRE